MGAQYGAATALLHADRDPSIAGIVVDSAFASLEQLVEEVVERGRQEGLTLPGFLVKIVLKFIRSSVKKRAHFDLRRLAPIDHAPCPLSQRCSSLQSTIHSWRHTIVTRSSRHTAATRTLSR